MERWRGNAYTALETAKYLLERDDCRSCISRAYYATYQVATSICLEHGDRVHFPPDWNNPTHEQLPDLIANNGNIKRSSRRRIATALRQLRTFREDADYRHGITVDAQRAREAILLAVTVFALLEVQDD